MTPDLAELVALVNGRLPEGSVYHIDPTREATIRRSYDHYWELWNGEVRHSWMHVKPDERNPLRDPFILWTEDPEVALQRILGVERRRATAGYRGVV